MYQISRLSIAAHRRVSCCRTLLKLYMSNNHNNRVWHFNIGNTSIAHWIKYPLRFFSVWDLKILRTWFRNANQWYPITNCLGGFNLKASGTGRGSSRGGRSPPQKGAEPPNEKQTIHFVCQTAQNVFTCYDTELNLNIVDKLHTRHICVFTILQLYSKVEFILYKLKHNNPF